MQANRYGLFIDSYAEDNTIRDNTIKLNTGAGILLQLATIDPVFVGNRIFNNLLNNTNNVNNDGSIYDNEWNTALVAGTNIVGGPNHSMRRHVIPEKDSHGAC